MGQRVNIVEFAGRTASVTATQPCHYSVTAETTHKLVSVAVLQ